MQVWVVMGNDYPDAVFSNEAAAQAYCAHRKAENESNAELGYVCTVYWRVYNFTLDDRVPT